MCTNIIGLLCLCCFPNTIYSNDLTGDILTLTGTSIDLNGGSIFNEGNDGDTEGINISYGSAAIDRGGAGTLTATAT